MISYIDRGDTVQIKEYRFQSHCFQRWIWINTPSLDFRDSEIIRALLAKIYKIATCVFTIPRGTTVFGLGVSTTKYTPTTIAQSKNEIPKLQHQIDCC